MLHSETMTMHPVKSDSDEPDDAPNRAAFDGGGGDGYDGSMRERVTKLEAFAAEAFRRFERLEATCERLDRTCERLERTCERLERTCERLERTCERIDTEVKVLRQDLNEYRVETKRDIENAIRWIVGVMLAISMAAITIITFVLNYATPKAEPAAQQPIVIYATAPPTIKPPAQP